MRDGRRRASVVSWRTREMTADRRCSDDEHDDDNDDDGAMTDDPRLVEVVVDGTVVVMAVCGAGDVAVVAAVVAVAAVDVDVEAINDDACGGESEEGLMFGLLDDGDEATIRNVDGCKHET
mmetsp:Transcript_58638/g.143391  ORF Transcript_58638/g.143391 Transcript_58638/m.143391 type:complete len:121 (-) Transcript_58638:328-690(-)